MITIQPNDYLFEHNQHSEYAPQFFDEQATEPDCTLCTQDAIALALQGSHLTADQALWLHQHHVNWQINVSTPARKSAKPTVFKQGIHGRACLGRKALRQLMKKRTHKPATEQ